MEIVHRYRRQRETRLCVHEINATDRFPRVALSSDLHNNLNKFVTDGGQQYYCTLLGQVFPKNTAVR